MTTAVAPLRLARDRVWFLAILAALYASLPYILVPRRILEVATLNDFANYWSAGATVGTPVLTDRSRLYAWQTAHGLAQQPFVYPPGFAWVYSPFAHMAPPVFALFAEQAVMIGVFALAALLIARIYGFGKLFAAGIVFAWGPTVCTVEAGQNTGIAVVLTLGVIAGLVWEKPVLTGLALGLLLYKPTDAAILVLLLMMRRQWYAIGVAALCGVGWYLLSVYGAAGDWHWPATYLDTVHAWYARNSGGNAHLVYTLPTMLLANGASTAVAFVASAGLMLAAAPLFRRASALEAGSMAPLVGLAASVHAWSYSAAIALPAIAYAMVRIPEPLRTRVIVITYACGAVGVSMIIGGPALAAVCIGGTVWWFVSAYRRAPEISARPLEVPQ